MCFYNSGIEPQTFKKPVTIGVLISKEQNINVIVKGAIAPFQLFSIQQL